MDDRVACTVGLLTSELFAQNHVGLKKDITRPSRRLSHALPAVSRRTCREAGSRQPSRESPYGLEATGYSDWGRLCVVQTIASFER